jgi:two-component system NtrC family sensor kinase
MLLVAAAAVVIVAAVGAFSINRSVVREAQNRVNHDLDTALSLYDQRFRMLAQQVQSRTGSLTAQDAAPGTAARLHQWRQQLDLTVLNLCGPDGEPIAGTYPDEAGPVPVGEDPVLRRALAGESARGTVLLTSERLQSEGGAALRNLVAVAPARSDQDTGTTSALFTWLAQPVEDANGRVVALAYGGRAFNHNYALVDSLRDTIFGTELHEGKPLGTVTVFLGPTRVATNVLRSDGRRAVGTVVSEEVRQAVLQKGRRWQDRAWVVDAWYLSGYEPLRNPDGETLGMLYVGLLEAPYNALRMRLLARFLVPTAVVLIVGLLAVTLIVRQITRPLRELRDSAEHIAEGDWDHPVPQGRAYTELTDLADSFRQMQSAIRQRDQKLREQNRTLSDTNEQLERANRNYMQTLGFVTHELKSPLAAIQGHIDLLVGGLVGEVPEKAKHLLVRVKRNCEELQDMVKNYLDLSRAERGELAAEKREIDLIADVVAPCVDQSQALFESRSMQLQTDLPDELPLTADPELLRIALTNYLSNAAKYGREGGNAKLTVKLDEGEVSVRVWNEGQGFTDEDRQRLFQKFSRLRNKQTADKRGSGLGLWLCKEAVELHGGSVDARSEPGAWAEFTFRVPADGGSRASA